MSGHVEKKTKVIPSILRKKQQKFTLKWPVFIDRKNLEAKNAGKTSTERLLSLHPGFGGPFALQIQLHISLNRKIVHVWLPSHPQLKCSKVFCLKLFQGLTKIKDLIRYV
jgi:hypothetical protein